jgi:hypothetical protein
MQVVRFSDFEAFGQLPRSSDNLTELLSDMNNEDVFVVFISHRWLRPWHTREECVQQGHTWAGMPHPDNAAGDKHALICAGIKRLAQLKEWNIHKVCLWLDFCGVEQDDADLLLAGVDSLRGYISLCDAVLIPSLHEPVEGAWTVDRIEGGYGERAWTRLESMSFYAVSLLRLPERVYAYVSVYVPWMHAYRMMGPRTCMHACIYMRKESLKSTENLFFMSACLYVCMHMRMTNKTLCMNENVKGLTYP